jgi:hypothetical protein
LARPRSGDASAVFYQSACHHCIANTRPKPRDRAISVPNHIREQFKRLFRQLGKLQAYNGAKGDAKLSVTTQNGKVISAAYFASADFDTGPAEIKISLIKHRDQWQLPGIQINSKVFMEEP